MASYVAVRLHSARDQNYCVSYIRYCVRNMHSYYVYCVLGIVHCVGLLGIVYWVLRIGYRVLRIGYRVLRIGYRVLRRPIGYRVFFFFFFFLTMQSNALYRKQWVRCVSCIA